MKTLLTLCFLFIATVLYSQPQFTGWLATFNTFKTGKKFSIHNDVQLRSSDKFKHTQTLLLRAGLNYHVTKSVVATAGVAYIHNRREMGDVSGYAPEYRIWQQVLLNHKVKQLMVGHRFRLEQRFISKTVVDGDDLRTDGTVYANRLRYFIRNVLPLQKRETFSKGLFAALQNEVFVNIGNTANVNGEFFDQNRLYLAVGYRLQPEIDLELGYMNQYTNGRGSAFTNNHIAQVATYLRF